MSEPLHEWKLVTDHCTRLPTQRMRVPGGWLYTAFTERHDSLGLVFVPDPPPAPAGGQNAVAPDAADDGWPRPSGTA